ncbi:orotidine-5'-phosphate decarboxylase [Candidatus Acetothermia bacterium]|nr:orotidine-5'-phosphate decarboxylase [Candidatus Acetothermia bacterium]MBI3461266.1 orotidine-5'-phosphate decarboxylase [Candidatus Acetothermia bacterium]MBI3660584.1 orotidine-5'-phosphate decarboxylase [Candidatus Acetothermia bacterium]
MAKLDAVCASNQSLLCIGLDPEYEKLPRFLVGKYGVNALFEFNKQIIDATADLVCAYKPNLAFYEALGPAGLEELQKTREYIPKEIITLADAKRGDLENTARQYAKALFEFYQFDSATVNPLMGYDSLAPYLRYSDKLIFLLCRTSNPGARDFQELNCEGKPLYQHLAESAREWNKDQNIGLVVGATAPRELGIIRKTIGNEMPILLPGIGAQSGDLEQSVKNGMGANKARLLVNVSRDVIFASSEKDFVQAARRRAEHWRARINQYRKNT